MATPQIKVHDTLGVLVRFDGEDTWCWIHPSGPQAGRMNDDFASRPGWRDVAAPEPEGQ